MKRTLAFCGLAAILLCLTACINTEKPISPYDHGVAVGSAAYLGYTHIAAKQSPEFHEQVAALWAKVDAIDSTDNLASTLAGIVAEMTDLFKSDKLTEADRTALKALAAMILNRIDGKLAEEAKERPEAIEFLKGVRDGVNTMRAL